jgi:hypothetical protein
MVKDLMDPLVLREQYKVAAEVQVDMREVTLVVHHVEANMADHIRLFKVDVLMVHMVE